MGGLDWALVIFLVFAVGLGMTWFIKAAYAEDEE